MTVKLISTLVSYQVLTADNLPVLGKSILNPQTIYLSLGTKYKHMRKVILAVLFGVKCVVY
jgi:hypothetical protein